MEHKLTPADVRARLEKIPDEDLRLLGINPDVARPEWTILTVLPVPPVTMRPSIILENGQRSEDDLTHKLVDIIRINQRFKENQDAGAPHLIIEDLWELLQYHVTTYLDNEVAGLPARTAPEREAVKDPLPAAEGEGWPVQGLALGEAGELLCQNRHLAGPQHPGHRGRGAPRHRPGDDDPCPGDGIQQG